MLYSLGRQDEFEESFNAAQQMLGDEWPGGIAEVYAWTGDADAAFELLDKELIPGRQDFSFDFLTGAAWSPVYRKLHDDPRWQAYWDETGWSADELQAIEFNINLAE